MAGLAGVCTSVSAQQGNIEYLTTKDGLSQNTVRGIVKDKYGFMWFGTMNGLCRYDGYKFKVYRSIPGDTTSLSSSRVHHLFKDEKGIIWVTTFNKIVCRYNYESDNFTRFALAELSPALRDSVNRVRDFEQMQHASGLLQSLFGPYHLSSTKEHFVFGNTALHKGGLNDININCFYQDNMGILWFGTGFGGVNKLDFSSGKFNSVPLHSAQKPEMAMAVMSVCTGPKGIWLGTEEDGLFFRDRSTGDQRLVASKGENIKALFRDSRGNIWVGKRYGLDKFNPATGALRSYYTAQSPANYTRFHAIAEDPLTGEIWIAYYKGILKYLPSEDRMEDQYIKPYTISGAGDLFFDSRNNLWLGTEYSGLIQLKRDPVDHHWTDTVVYAALGSKSQTGDERIYSIAEDHEGTIWVGSANGLYRINPRTDSITVYTINDGLADHYITKVLPDFRGCIWLAHKSGLSKLDIKTGAIQNYSVGSSDEEYEFINGSGFYDPYAATIYLGTTKGFVNFKPLEIVNNPYLPKVVFTSLQVLNKSVNIGDTINGRRILEHPLYMTQSITLTHQDRSFSVEFAALHFSDPQKNQFAYILEGQDKDWTYTNASRRFASYSNLPAGKYYLKVKASNSNGSWNPKPSILEIRVLPPWWLTWWAYLIYILTGLLLLGLIIRAVHLRQRYHRQILIERLKAEKALEMDQLKSNFFTNISHEFRTPLTLIIDPLRSLLSMKGNSEKQRFHFDIMHRNAQRLLALINQFLDFRKIEAGKMPLHPQRQDIAAFIKNTAAAFDFKATQQQIQFNVETSPEEIQMDFDADLVGKIMYNLVSNAFKYTRKDGRITISVQADSALPDQVRITVRDNGVGIPQKDLPHIFDPFFQSGKNQQEPGTGVGLSLTRELVQLHQGIIEVQSVPEQETVFSFTLKNLDQPSVGAQHPVTDCPPVPEEALAPAAVKTRPTQPILLVIEDNDDIRTYIHQQLSATYTIIEAVNGRQGWERAVTEIPDLIVTDVMMPEISGLKLCEMLKTDEKTSHIPVIILTARQSEQYELEGYQTGADAYVSKPFSMTVLSARIQSILDNRRKLREYFSQHPQSLSHPVGLNAADQSFLQKLTDLVSSHMAETEVNVEWLASKLFMSRTQLYRKLKALTDQSVHEFITTIRLHKAAGLLAEGQLSVTEIAYMVGYADSTSFSRIFQKQYGTTPKKYSLQQQRPGIIHS
ncbi:two-component regulator propeller domain-containing protein [Niabella terrae]